MQLKIEVSAERLREIGEPMMKAINEAQMNGFTLDEVLCAMMVTLGSALRQGGVVMDLDKPLREALPPIATGYKNTKVARRGR